jgi:magnesium-transporting ATPase (P-type)
MLHTTLLFQYSIYRQEPEDGLIKPKIVAHKNHLIMSINWAICCVWRKYMLFIYFWIFYAIVGKSHWYDNNTYEVYVIESAVQPPAL